MARELLDEDGAHGHCRHIVAAGLGSRPFGSPGPRRQPVTRTPVVDGSGIKDTLEKQMIQWIQAQKILDFAKETVLLASALDRYAMAETIVSLGSRAIFADKIFALQLDQPIYTLEDLELQARHLLPDLVKMPISMLYPVGKSQTQIEPTPLTDHYFDQATVIAGDFHIIRRRLPDSLQGKTVITNTVTTQDIQELRSRGLRQLITSTPEFQGRSYGTNVLEALVVALLPSPPPPIWEVNPEGTPTTSAWVVRDGAYLSLLKQLQIQPRFVQF